MRFFTLPVVAAALSMIPAGEALAQSGLRFASKNTTPAARPAGAAKTKLAVQVTDDSGEIVEGDAGGDYVAGGYSPSDARAGLTAGCAFGGAGVYGYNPDFGVGPNGMSVWPGVPACCDPWLGYCGEPRCFSGCTCKQGTYQVYHCRHGACRPELVTWQKDDWKHGCCKPAGMCYGAKDCGNSCSTCRPASYSPAAEETPAVNAAPAEKAAPPRNEIPKTPSTNSARRMITPASR